jgi:hypothetical protein
LIREDNDEDYEDRRNEKRSKRRKRKRKRKKCDGRVRICGPWILNSTNVLSWSTRRV